MAKKYTREDRYNAAALLTATGNSMAVSRESGIPASTIRYWAQHDEDFEFMCQEIRTEFGEKIKYKLAQIVDESADQILDRLKNGDVIRDNKTGELVRVPIKGKEAAIIGAIAFDKLRISESQPTHITRHESSKDLQSIYNEFRDLSRKAVEEERKFARGKREDIE
jgi:hypothetical protein